jgi:hypothetical protein
MNLQQAREIAADTARLAQLIDLPFEQWAHRCHGVSIALVKAKVFGYSRVARGVCKDSAGAGQHSWIVLDEDVYRPSAVLVDPTLWSYDTSVRGIWVGSMARDKRHHPKGKGSIWAYGHPANCHPADAIEIKQDELSPQARHFLELLGPLDRRGWMELADGPMEGWPSREIIPAIMAAPPLTNVVPIDIQGMLTDANPGGLYLAD